MDEATIKMTSKGTFTLPVSMRRRMGLRAKGDTLVIRYNSKTEEAVISKPQDFRELQETTLKYADRKKPLVDVDEFYQRERGVEG